jgi:hypothetical protein
MVMNEVHYINKVNEKTKPEERLRTIVLTLNMIGNNDNRCTKKKGSVNLINVPNEIGTEMQRF